MCKDPGEEMSSLGTERACEWLERHERCRGRQGQRNPQQPGQEGPGRRVARSLNVTYSKCTEKPLVHLQGGHDNLWSNCSLPSGSKTQRDHLLSFSAGQSLKQGLTMHWDTAWTPGAIEGSWLHWDSCFGPVPTLPIWEAGMKEMWNLTY